MKKERNEIMIAFWIFLTILMIFVSYTSIILPIGIFGVAWMTNLSKGVRG